jgi:hypothetical protein
MGNFQLFTPTFFKPRLSGCAFCLVAGGLGERLGFPGIKQPGI